MIDISRSNNDIYYRYKMPKVVVKHEGKSGNTRTIITNLEEISSSLKRTPLYILKYISYELATRTDASGGRYAVNGKYEPSKIQELIYDFIDEFIMCPHCNNPETFYINSDGLSMECLACGVRSKMKSSKLSGMILKDVEKNNPIQNDMYSSIKDVNNNENDDELEVLMNSDEDRSKEIVELLRGTSDEDIIMRLLSIDEEIFKKCRTIINYISPKVVLNSIEGFIERNERIDDIQNHLMILEEGKMFKRSELFKHFTRPQSNRKRSPEFKKRVNEYFSSQ